MAVLAIDLVLLAVDMAPQAGKRFPLEVATARLSLDTTPLAGKLFLRAGNRVQLASSLAEVCGKTIPLMPDILDLCCRW